MSKQTPSTTGNQHPPHQRENLFDLLGDDIDLHTQTSNGTTAFPHLPASSGRVNNGHPGGLIKRDLLLEIIQNALGLSKDLEWKKQQHAKGKGQADGKRNDFGSL